MQTELKQAEGQRRQAADEPLVEAQAVAQPPAFKVESRQNSIGIELVRIPKGEFLMGSPSTEKDRVGNEGQVRVTLSQEFLLGKTEVTIGQWQQVMSMTPWGGSSSESGGGLPVVMVSWADVTQFCAKLTERERTSGAILRDEQYRLPTEAEWEYACRAGTKTAYSFGDEESRLGEFGWFGGNSGGQPHEVGKKNPNAWGFCDMHGNVWEWCSDRYSDKPPGGFDPDGPADGSDRVLRGGRWNSTARDCRSAIRRGLGPSNRSDRLGFRLALSLSVTNAGLEDRKIRQLDAKAPQIKLPLTTAVNSIGIHLLEIPANSFQMGEGSSAVTKTLMRSFWLGKTEVTRVQWQKVMRTTPWSGTTATSDADFPAVSVSWDDVTEFCKKLTQYERDSGNLPAGEIYRLPTGAEWESACRAGTTTAYSFNDNQLGLGEFAWFHGNSDMAQPVGTKKPNQWGLRDMHGNVWEWCSDLSGSGPFRVLRGGSWRCESALCRSAQRTALDPSTRIDNAGFRVARSQPAK